MATNDTCTQCESEYKHCISCGEKIVFVPKAGFGNVGEYQHLDQPEDDAITHEPHPKFHIT